MPGKNQHNWVCAITNNCRVFIAFRDEASMKAGKKAWVEKYVCAKKYIEEEKADIPESIWQAGYLGVLGMCHYDDPDTVITIINKVDAYHQKQRATKGQHLHNYNSIFTVLSEFFEKQGITINKDKGSITIEKRNAIEKRNDVISMQKLEKKYVTLHEVTAELYLHNREVS